MDIIETGYHYRVYDLKGENPQDIRFIKRNSLGTFDPGTTNEELVDVLIARMYALQTDNSSSENQCVIILLKAIRQLLNKIITKKIRHKNGNARSNQEYFTHKKGGEDLPGEQQALPIHEVDE